MPAMRQSKRSATPPAASSGPEKQTRPIMPKIKTADGTNLYYEEIGTGTPIVFVHEFAGDYRQWEPQMRYFARSHRCVTYSQRGYPPSDVPDDPTRYGQDMARSDVIALMDALGIQKAHVVGHSMGAYTAVHVGLRHPDRCISVTAAGCGWGSLPDPAQRAAMRKVALETSAMFIEKGMAEAAKIYGDGQMRQTHKHKDPRGYAEFIRMLSEHSALGHALTMSMLQSKRPNLWDLEADLKKFSVPLLIIVGDEDESCLDGSVFLKRTAPTAGLLVIPRASHTITTEEPAATNAALAELFAAAEAGRWMSHRAPA
jgi:pimeloyl-ACP methyl ester carboxylesterase